MSAPRLGYVVRFATSLDATVDFYQRVLGLRLSKRGGHWAQFDCGSLTLGIYERAAMARVLRVDDAALGTAPGAAELAFEVADCDAAYAAALAAGAPSFSPPEERPWGERTAYLLDPDGGLVELYTHVARGRVEVDADAEDAEQGEQARRDEMATPSSVSTQHGDPSD